MKIKLSPLAQDYLAITGTSKFEAFAHLILIVCWKSQNFVRIVSLLLEAISSFSNCLGKSSIQHKKCFV